MAEISPKRHREEPYEASDSDSISSDLDGFNSSSKRQKPYNNILNLLDEEEPEQPSHVLNQDLSAIFTTFQQELSSSATTTFDLDSLPSAAEVNTADRSQLSASAVCGDEDESVKSVMRHLLEASDDELGIPNAGDDNGVENLNSGDNLPFAFTDDNGLWELEDVAANYYTILQSELFM